jgi:hypothetical protein
VQPAPLGLSPPCDSQPPRPRCFRVRSRTDGSMPLLECHLTELYSRLRNAEIHRSSRRCIFKLGNDISWGPVAPFLISGRKSTMIDVTQARRAAAVGDADVHGFNCG